MTDYLEARVRVDFINPFFQVLGWDVGNVGGLPGRFFKFSAPYLRQVPIKRIDFADRHERRIHDSIVDLVNEQMKLGLNQRDALTPQEASRLGRQRAALDTAIDDMVQKLYGATSADVELITGGADRPTRTAIS